MKKLPLRLSDEAEKDIQEISEYHVEILPALVDMFFSDFDAACNDIESFPEAWPVHDGVRRKLLGQFSYVIYYEIKPRHINLLRVFHTSRRPDSWR